MSLSARTPSVEGLIQGNVPPVVAAGGAEQLHEAFRVFNEAASKVGDYYSLLEKRIAELNVELEDANGRLRRNLDEKQRVQNYLSALLESLPVGVMGVDGEGKITSCNRHAAESLECDAERVRGRGLMDAFGFSRPHAALQRVVASRFGRTDSLELNFNRPSDGRRRILRVQTVPSDSQAPSGEKGSGHGRDEAAGVLLIEDVTEMRRLEHQAERNNRLAAMGEIAMNVAHEIRNPLGSIELFASMLQRDLAGDPVHGELAKHICTGVRCLDHIVANILQFSKPQRLACGSFDLVDLIEETFLLAEHALSQKEIRIERSYARPQIPVWADGELLRQMFLNLFLNAIQATGRGGVIGVKSMPNCETVEIQVWDSGCGLPEGEGNRIFDPFFTTRRKGTGLGLTIVHNIVSAHHGSIEAENRPGGGAVFSIVLPMRVPEHADGAEVKTPFTLADSPVEEAGTCLPEF